MPSVFQNRFDPGRTRLNGTFGRPAVYTAPDATVISGFFARTRANAWHVSVNQGRTTEIQIWDVMVNVSDLANPVKGGRFNVDGDVLTIDADPSQNNGVHVCVCSRMKSDKRGERRMQANG